MRVLFYAFGGGAGHFCRSQAVARAMLALRDLKIRILAPDRLKAWSVPPIEVKSPVETDRDSLREWVSRQLDDFQPDSMIVDVFPRGVLGELFLPISLKRVLITRWVHPEYYERAEVAEAISSYELVFTSEPVEARLAPPIQQVSPIVWTKCDRSRKEARNRLGGDDRPLIVALGSGPPKAQLKLRFRIQAHCDQANSNLEFYSQGLGRAVPEIGRSLHGADLIVSAAGYQSYHEILQSGVPSVFLPQRRRYDNQAGRALGRFGPKQNAESAVARTPTELISLLSQLLKAPKKEPVSYMGAQEIARRVLCAEADSPR